MAFADLSTNSVVDYNQMIMEAIEELNSNQGANITEINNYIESNYPDLPPAHSSLLSNTLDKLRLSGHLVYSGSIFSKPDSNPNQTITPAKRGRGRPPKPKSDTGPIAPAYTGSPRPRGRPPKVVDPLAPPPQPKVKPSSSGRGRGRPRKDPLSVAVPVPVSVSGVKRGRGRPRKNA